MSKRNDMLSRGYSHGNYAEAYETRDPAVMLDNLPDDCDAHAALLGFFSSYEDHEIPGEWIDSVVEARNFASADLRAIGIMD